MADPARSIILWFFTVLIILVLLLIANSFVYVFNNMVVSDLVAFLNRNILLIIGISLFFLLGSLFYGFGKGFELVTPVFDSIGSVLTIAIIIGLINLLDIYLNTGIGELIMEFSYIIYLLVFLLALVFGYFAILGRRRSARKDLVEEEIIEDPKKEKRVFRRYLRKK